MVTPGKRGWKLGLWQPLHTPHIHTPSYICKYGIDSGDIIEGEKAYFNIDYREREKRNRKGKEKGTEKEQKMEQKRNRKGPENGTEKDQKMEQKRNRKGTENGTEKGTENGTEKDQKRNRKWNRKGP